MPSKYSGYGVAGAASVGFMHPTLPVAGCGMVLPSYQLIYIIKPHAWEIPAWMRSFKEDLASPSLASPEVVIGKEEVDPEQREGPDAQPSPKPTHSSLEPSLFPAEGRREGQIALHWSPSGGQHAGSVEGLGPPLGLPFPSDWWCP